MTAQADALIDLETKFWQSMVDDDAQVAIDLLAEPALMVSPMGSMLFDHAQYRKMAEQGTMIVRHFEFSDMNVTFASEDTAILTYRVKQDLAKRDGGDIVTQDMYDSSTWVRDGRGWKCVMHTESPVEAKPH